MNLFVESKLLRTLTALSCLAPTHFSAQTPVKTTPSDIGAYIRDSWHSLERSTSSCSSVSDPKVNSIPVVYLPADMETPPSLGEMKNKCNITMKKLPRKIHQLGDVRPGDDLPPGLLYLPHPYVVPGGRFNEMYGWDSYFIILGLVDSGRVPLAKGIVENFFFEIANYGGVLNANRTYFLTRSQPPLLSSMIAEVYGKTHDTAWLRNAYQFAKADYALWNTKNHRAGETGLARYSDLSGGPVPEMADDNSYYPDVVRWLVAHPSQRRDYLVPGSAHPDAAEAERLRRTSCDVLSSKVCANAYADGFRLSSGFFRGDRAMRESGFDTSFRFGPFSGSTDDYAPICLNSLLYKYERDMASFAAVLGEDAEARNWTELARARKHAINKYLWTPNSATFSDYNFKTHRTSSYRYLSEFYPLWAGLATPAQARHLESQLRVFERPGGLAASNFESGTQWDLPYGWAPLQWFAIDGLVRYGFFDDASRLAEKFSKTVEENYKLDGTIREKYNVVSQSAEVAVRTGYKTNAIGFGWTNGVYERLARIRSSKAALYESSEEARRNAASALGSSASVRIEIEGQASTSTVRTGP